MKHDINEADAGEDEEMLERVSAIDVAKALGRVCVRLPGKQRRITRVFDVAATTNAIMALADELAEMGIERIVVESTSDYWRPFFYLLEADQPPAPVESRTALRSIDSAIRDYVHEARLGVAV